MEEKDAEENIATHEKIKEFLTEKGVPFTLLTHKACKTSEESAQARGVSIDSGAKALLIKDCGKNSKQIGIPYYLAVMSASQKFASKEFKRIIGSKNIRFASADEVTEITGCLPGAVPPFGSIFDIPIWVDRSLSRQDVINFNCGLRTASITMRYDDYIAAECPKTHVFTEEELETDAFSEKEY